MSQKKLFISHAVKDKELADALVDLIETGTPLKSSDIFCSSLEGLGIPSGEDFISYIKSQIQEPESVILLLSPNYFASPFCLCEMGASWAMAHNILPLLVPPLTYDNVKGVLSVTQIDKLNDVDDLNKFVTQLKEHLSLSEINLPRWETKKKKFLKALPEVLESIPQIVTVSPETHEELMSKYEDALNEMQEYEEEIDRLNAKIADLKQCKDSDEVDVVERQYSTALDALDGKFKDLKKLLKKLPTIFAYILYKEFNSQNVIFNPWEDSEKIKEADSAVEEDYLTFDSEAYALNHEDPSVKKAWKSLNQLGKFINIDLSEEDFSAYESESGYSLSLSNRRLWHDEISEYMSRF